MATARTVFSARSGPEPQGSPTVQLKRFDVCRTWGPLRQPYRSGVWSGARVNHPPASDRGEATVPRERVRKLMQGVHDACVGLPEGAVGVNAVEDAVAKGVGLDVGPCGVKRGPEPLRQGGPGGTVIIGALRTVRTPGAGGETAIVRAQVGVHDGLMHAPIVQIHLVLRGIHDLAVTGFADEGPRGDPESGKAGVARTTGAR